MKKLTVLIADDESLARDSLRLLLGRDPSIGRILEAGNGPSAVTLIAAEKPDLVFLDVQMPGCGGFEVVKQIGAANMPPVIFATAYDAFAVKAFDVHAVDYLLKPFTDARFSEALTLVKQGLLGDDERENLRLDRLMSYLNERNRPTPPVRDRIIVRASGEVFFLPIDDVYWLEAQGDYVKIYTKTKDYLIRETMKQMEDTLDAAVFGRVHRSAIVNLHRVKRLTPRAFGDYTLWLDNGLELKVSRTYYAKLSGLLGL